MQKGIENLLNALDIDPALIPEGHDYWGCNLESYYHDWTDGILRDLMYVHETSDDLEELKVAEREYDEAMRDLRIEVMEYLDSLKGGKPVESRWTEDVNEALKVMVNAELHHELWSEKW